MASCGMCGLCTAAWERDDADDSDSDLFEYFATVTRAEAARVQGECADDATEDEEPPF